MLPPESTTATRRPATSGTWPPSSAATPTAPAPSTTSFCRSRSSAMASTISSSVTATISCTCRWTSGKVSSPGRLTAMPSAIVCARTAASICPCCTDRTNAAQPVAWTPTTRTPGSSAVSASAEPASRPPPPHGTTTRSTSGTCSASSSPTVPCPAMMRSSSNAEMKVAPVLAARSRAAACASSKVEPWSAICGAVADRRLHLGHRRVDGHEDRRLHAERARRERDALRVVAGARRDDAAGALVGAERRDAVVGAADLEGAGALEVLGLHQHLGADPLGQEARREDRRAGGDALDGRGGRADGVEVGHAGSPVTCPLVRRPAARRRRGRGRSRRRRGGRAGGRRARRRSAGAGGRTTARPRS